MFSVKNIKEQCFIRNSLPSGSKFVLQIFYTSFHLSYGLLDFLKGFSGGNMTNTICFTSVQHREEALGILHSCNRGEKKNKNTKHVYPHLPPMEA